MVHSGLDSRRFLVLPEVNHFFLRKFSRNIPFMSPISLKSTLDFWKISWGMFHYCLEKGIFSRESFFWEWPVTTGVASMVTLVGLGLGGVHSCLPK